MTDHSYFRAECSCGRVNKLQVQGEVFTCGCGRKSLVDFSIGYSERELVEILNNLDAQRDHVARVLEIRRDRKSA
jgi:hypothetical protein